MKLGPRARVGAIIFIVGALAVSAFSIYRTATAPQGTERDEILLACTKCGQDTRVSSAALTQLAHDPRGGYECPKCHERTALVASSVCPQCKRAIPPQPPTSALECPFCKHSLRVEDNVPPDFVPLGETDKPPPG
jgi:Zn finger protein HypA/HybF involved in hydrogenase expression